MTWSSLYEAALAAGAPDTTVSALTGARPSQPRTAAA